MPKVQKNTRSAFSLIELVIVVVIIGIIAAIAIPRLSRGSAGAADSALSGNLAVLRSAIDLYATEHNGTYPAAATFAAQLTTFTDSTGSAAAAKDSTHIYGPYLRAVPPLPIGTNKTSTVVIDASSGAVGATAGGWYYNATTGEIKANCVDTEKDVTTKSYNSY